MEPEMEHLLAGIRHLAAHSPEVLEAIPDGMDVGHSHEHNLTVGVVLCRCKRGEWSLRACPGNRDKSGPSWHSFPGRAEPSKMRTKYTLDIEITLLLLDAQVPYISSSNINDK